MTGLDEHSEKFNAVKSMAKSSEAINFSLETAMKIVLGGEALKNLFSDSFVIFTFNVGRGNSLFMFNRTRSSHSTNKLKSLLVSLAIEID